MGCDFDWTGRVASEAKQKKFIRFAWNNGTGRIKPETFAEVRKELGDRQTALSPEEVVELYPK